VGIVVCGVGNAGRVKESGAHNGGVLPAEKSIWRSIQKNREGKEEIKKKEVGISKTQLAGRTRDNSGKRGGTENSPKLSTSAEQKKNFNSSNADGGG